MNSYVFNEVPQNWSISWDASLESCASSSSSKGSELLSCNVERASDNMSTGSIRSSALLCMLGMLSGLGNVLPNKRDERNISLVVYFGAEREEVQASFSSSKILSISAMGANGSEIAGKLLHDLYSSWQDPSEKIMFASSGMLMMTFLPAVVKGLPPL